MTINSNEKDYTKLREELNENNTYWLHKLVPEGKIIKSEYRAGSFMGGASRKGDGSFSYDLTKNIYKDHVDSSIGRNRHGIFGLYQEQHPEAKPHEVYAYFKGEPVDHVKVKQLKKQVEAPQEKPNTAYFKSEADQEKLIEALETHSKNRAKRNEWEFVCNHYYTRPDKTIVYVMARFKKKDGNKEIRPISRILNTEKITGYGVPSKKFIPYKLHEIMGNDKPILMVEGEKTVDYIEPIIKEHFAVTTFTYGAGTISRLEAESFRHFKDRKVFLWPDKDAEGQGYEAFKLAAQTLEKVAKSVAIVDVRKIKQLTIEKNDLADLVEDKAIQTYEDFFKMLSENLRGNKPAPIEPEVEKVRVVEPDAVDNGELSTTELSISSANAYEINAVLDRKKTNLKIKEADIDDAEYVLHRHDKLGLKMYHDKFLGASFMEYKDTEGNTEVRNLDDSKTVGIINSTIVKKGIRGFKRQHVKDALDGYTAFSIPYIDSLQEYIKNCVERYPEDSIDFKAEDFASKYCMNSTKFNKHESKMFAMCLMNAWLHESGMPSDLAFIFESADSIKDNSNIGKTFLLKNLAPTIAGVPTYVDGGTVNFNDTRTVATLIQRCLILELSETSSLNADKEAGFKRFLSSTELQHDVKYKVDKGITPVRCITVGTTNESAYITDDTERRRVPFLIGGALANCEYQVSEDRDKIIAAFYYLYKNLTASGENHSTLFKDPAYQAYYLEKVKTRKIGSLWEDDIIRYLLGCRVGKKIIDAPLLNFSHKEVWEEMIKLARAKDYAQRDFPKLEEIRACCRRIGCERDKNNNGFKTPAYLLADKDRLVGKWVVEYNNQE